MAEIRKTHRGKNIDIDLIRMKHDLELKEINKINIKREKEIDNKRRRGNGNSKVNEMLANQELIRQKLREQKMKKSEDDNDEQVEAVQNERQEQVKQEVKKDKPEVVGRRVIKR